MKSKKPNYFNLTKPNGQILLEMIFIIGIISVVIVGLVKSLTTSLRNVQLVRENTQAESYAKETVEWLIYQRDNDWSNLQNRINRIYCLNSLSWPAIAGACGGVTPITGTNYFREVFLFEVIPGQEISTTITVTWPSLRSGETITETISIVQNLTKWR